MYAERKVRKECYEDVKGGGLGGLNYTLFCRDMQCKDKTSF